MAQQSKPSILIGLVEGPDRAYIIFPTHNLEHYLLYRYVHLPPLREWFSDQSGRECMLGTHFAN